MGTASPAKVEVGDDQVVIQSLSGETAKKVLLELVRMNSGLSSTVNDAARKVKATQEEFGTRALEAVAPGEEEDQKRELTPEQAEVLLGTLEARFKNEKHKKLHVGIQWDAVKKFLEKTPENLWSLQQLEASGGEPDVTGETEGEFIFEDCSLESPSGRRNVAYDREAQTSAEQRGECCNGNAVDIANRWRVEMQDKASYLKLQGKLRMDSHTDSFLGTPQNIRKNGAALVGSRGDVRVFVREYAARDRYDARGWRAALRVRKET